jgi:hypothetical protein
MRRIIIGVLISMLVISSGMGAFTSATTQKKLKDPIPIDDRDYSHNIFGEFFTMTTCVPCKYSHRALVKLYEGDYHPFYYITYVYNKNNHSKMRKSELQIVGSPTTDWDGSFDRIVGGGPTTEERMAEFNESILDCGARTVKDIDLSLNVEWQGAVNRYPPNGATNIPIEVILNWTISEMKIDVEVTNNEASEYDGHLHIQVTEVESEWWDDKFGDPYTFEFKDYAYNGDTTISAGDSFSETIYWDGCDYNDADDPPRYFDHIEQDNIMVIASVFDKDNDKYVDETAGFLAGVNTDPKFFDVYFGDTNPPPKVISNGSAGKYNPPGNLDWETTYYWKIDVWDNNGDITTGDVIHFTTRGNAPPYEPNAVEPLNGTDDAPIDVNLSWFGGDPDFDDVTYDIYFGEKELGVDHPPQVEENFTGTEYDPTPFGQTLDFSTPYFWKIVAWDEYGLNTSGEIWEFTTEPNYPPNPVENERPPDGSKNVPVNASLFWNGSDPNSGDTLTYDVYFGTYSPPTQQTWNQSERFYDPYDEDDMELFADYFWKIVTWDKSGESSESPIFVFETGVNPPPSDPIINGPSSGGTDKSYDFTFVSTDPDDQRIRYHIEWDDGDITETGLFDSGEEITLNHTWTDKDKFTIRAKAIDEYGAASDFSDHEINIPRNRAVRNNNFIISWLTQRFPQMFPLLKYLLGL